MSAVEQMFVAGQLGSTEDAIADVAATLADKPTYIYGLAKRQVHAVRPSNKEEAMQQAIHHAIVAYHEDEAQRRVTEFLDDEAGRRATSTTHTRVCVSAIAQDGFEGEPDVQDGRIIELAAGHHQPDGEAVVGPDGHA